MQEQLLLENAPLTTDAAGLADFLREHYPALEKLVAAYWYSRKGTVSSLEIEEPVVYSTAVSGSFRVLYQVSFFFACDDVTTRCTEYMDLTFFLESGKGILSIMGELEPERGPDE